MNNFYPAIMLVLAMLAGCTPAMQKLEGQAQGTTYHISFWSDKEVRGPDLQPKVVAELERLDSQISNYSASSTIEKFNASSSTAPIFVSEEVQTLFERARTVSYQSGGCYDPTIQPLFSLWGFTSNHFNQPPERELTEVRKNIGVDKIESVGTDQLRKLVPDVRLDLSSIGQGYSVARLAGLLEQQGIVNYMVEIGGELQTRGTKPDGSHWRVAIERPLPGQRTVHKIITIKRDMPTAIMTSGTYRHYFDQDGKKFSHILDANTGKPVEHSTVSVTLIDSDPTRADAWSTALLCLGAEQGIKVADQENLAAFFIVEKDDALIEFPSQQWLDLQNINIE